MVQCVVNSIVLESCQDKAREANYMTALICMFYENQNSV